MPHGQFLFGGSHQQINRTRDFVDFLRIRLMRVEVVVQNKGLSERVVGAVGEQNLTPKVGPAAVLRHNDDSEHHGGEPQAAADQTSPVRSTGSRMLSGMR